MSVLVRASDLPVSKWDQVCTAMSLRSTMRFPVSTLPAHMGECCSNSFPLYKCTTPDLADYRCGSIP